MIARKTQKIIYNILILCFLIGGATYVCSRCAGIYQEDML